MPSLDVQERIKHSEPSLEYVSIGCNRTLHALSWGRNDVIAFGAGNSVAIYETKPIESAGKISYLLNRHTDKVSCVSWLYRTDGAIAGLVSGSVDKSISVWEQTDNHLEFSQQLEGHKSSVHALASVSFTTDENGKDISIIASAAADSNVIIWRKFENNDYEKMQELMFGNGFALSLAMTLLPKSNTPLLACGCVDSKIHLHSWHIEKFNEVETLHGHEDWIQTIDFSSPVGNDVFIASGSKDAFIRIWKISLKEGLVEKTDELKLEEQKFSCGKQEYTIVLESVVSGHDGWVNGVRWKKAFVEDGKLSQPMVVLSASMDKTMMLWELDNESGVWLDTARMGEVGGNTLGFYGCDFGPDGEHVISHGFQGAFHLWKNSGSQQWRPEVTVSGHFGPAQDFEWDPVNSEFLISVGLDQTARLHAPWRQKDKQLTWHEVARPQVHGYDMQCIACIDRSTYVSGSEEKVIRAFRAPKSFFDSLSAISRVSYDSEDTKALPVGASIPALGLSNKAVFKSDLENWKDESGGKSQPMKASTFASEDPAPYTPITISAPPPEDILLQNTLWPEVHKLYGHGFEIFCLACNRQGTVLASACKASKAEYANILLWDTKTWKQIGSLDAHSLTVTQLSFSNNGDWLLSVSRDRTWALFRKNNDESGRSCFNAWFYAS
eukprot:gene14029-5004_t